jgi:hypothetical protein
MNGRNRSKCSGVIAWAPICDATWFSPNAHARRITISVVIPTDGLIPRTMPNAKLHARRRGVTPPRSRRNSGRNILQRRNSRIDSGTSTSASDAMRVLIGCESTHSQAAGSFLPGLISLRCITGFEPVSVRAMLRPYRRLTANNLTNDGQFLDSPRVWRPRALPQTYEAWTLRSIRNDRSPASQRVGACTKVLFLDPSYFGFEYAAGTFVNARSACTVPGSSGPLPPGFLPVHTF